MTSRSDEYESNKPRRRYVLISLLISDSFANFSKMQDLKDAIENEVHNAHDEYLKLEAHIKLYITEMEQAI